MLVIPVLWSGDGGMCSAHWPVSPDTGESQVLQETLPQKNTWRVPEEDTQHEDV